MDTLNIYGAVCHLYLHKTEREKKNFKFPTSFQKRHGGLLHVVRATLQPEWHIEFTETLPSEMEHLVYLNFLLPWPADGQQSPVPRPPGTTGGSFPGKNTHSQ